MKKIYRYSEIWFEKLTSIATSILGNSITFIVAVCTVIYWLTSKEFYKQDIHHCIGDLILGVTFLSLFIIQKSFNRFSGSLHLKINELVSSHERASNAVINVDKKTELEIIELQKEYNELAEQVVQVEEEIKEELP
jgi:low affinity Fe/Cu permease